VSITYSMGDEAGNVVEQSDLPVSYIHGGSTELIGGMDQALAGKRVGDAVELHLPPEAGFGPHDSDLTFTDDLANVPPQFRRIGAEVQMQNDAGEVKSFYVTRIEGGRLTIDGNHPLAGKALRVTVTVREVRDPTPAELAQDRAGPASTGLH
jgi:FKBP-type peptidyl-prolyl cis-trans isomerase SlyD